MKTKKFYILYEEYSEFNQFEGGWTLHYSVFLSKRAAEKWRDGAQLNAGIRNISSVLTEAE